MSTSKRPIQLRDAQHQVIPHSFGTDGMNTSRGGTNYITYVGYCRPSTLVTQAGWLILKQTYDDTGTIVRVRFATTDDKYYADYDKIWDDSTAVTISSLTKADPAVVTTSTAHGYSTNNKVEIIGCDATEANGDGYGSVMFKIEVVNATSFKLIDVTTDDYVDSTGWVSAGTEGSVYARTYANHNFS